MCPPNEHVLPLELICLGPPLNYFHKILFVIGAIVWAVHFCVQVCHIIILYALRATKMSQNTTKVISFIYYCQQVFMYVGFMVMLVCRQDSLVKEVRSGWNMILLFFNKEGSSERSTLRFSMCRILEISYYVCM